ncbi:TRAP transporter small permease subunit [Rhodococcus sp. 5G237]
MSSQVALGKPDDIHRRPVVLRLVDRIAAGGVGLAGVLVGLMGFNIIIDILARVAGDPLPATLDMVQYLWMPGLALLALGSTELRSEQIRVTVLTDALSPVGAKVADIVGAIVVGGLMAWVTVLCWERAFAAFEIGEKTAVTNVPIWPGRFLVAIGVTLLLICAGARLCELFGMRATEKEPIDD